MFIVLLLVGLVVLTVGGDLLVRGASGIALRYGVKPLVVGLTVVAFGTSSPELAVSVNAAISGQADLTLGNVVGSNIFNVLFILGVSSLVIPLAVHKQLLRVDLPLMIALSLLAWMLAIDGAISRVDGIALACLLIGYIFLALRLSKDNKDGERKDDGAETAISTSLGKGLTLIVGGLVLLIVGSKLFVDGAVELARLFGLSELIIGLTVVAAGTSLPEVAASLIAAVKGQRDLAIGNVVGSNIFNIVGVMGVTSIITPVPVSSVALEFDLPVMLVVSMACLPIFFTGLLIRRWEGALFLGYYFMYVVYLILDHSKHAVFPAYKDMMLFYVIPLTVAVLVSTVMAELLRRKNRSGVST